MRKVMLNVGLLLVLAGFFYGCWLVLDHFYLVEVLTDDIISGDGWISVPLVESESAPMISAGFGSDRKQVVVLLDTGSDQFWVRNNMLAESSSKSLTQEAFTTVYAGGAVSGTHGSDDVSIGNVSWRQPLGLVTKSTIELQDINSILGLSRKCRKECSLSHLRLKEPQISFSFNLMSRKGSFLAGILNSSLCIEELHWVPLIPNHFFWRTRCSISLGSTSIVTNAIAIWDTGTTYTYRRNNLYTEMMKSLPGNGQSCAFANLPVITIELAGKLFSFPPEVYAQRRSDNTCEWRFARLEDTWGSRIEADLIIGWTLIRSHYVVFDMSKDAIALCRSQSLDFVKRTLF